MEIDKVDQKTLLESWKQILANQAALADLDKARRGVMGGSYYQANHQLRIAMSEAIARYDEAFPDSSVFWKWLQEQFKEAEQKDQKYRPDTPEHEAEVRTIWKAVEAKRKELAAQTAVDAVSSQGSSPGMSGLKQ